MITLRPNDGSCNDEYISMCKQRMMHNGSNAVRVRAEKLAVALHW